MEKQIITLEEFAELINEADEWELGFDDIIFANDWTPIFDEWHICHDGKNMIYFDDNGQAKVTSIEEAIKNRDEKMKTLIKQLENLVKDRKLTARAAEIKLLGKYDMYDLEDVLPHRRIDVIDFNNEYFYLENGECVWGEFPRQGKIYDNVEYCQDMQRFEFIEYFLKDEDEE